MELDLEKQKKEEDEKRKKMSQIAKVKYMEEKEALTKKSHTSFGKLILADEKTNPTFSFGQAQRFVGLGDIGRAGKNTPGPIYDVTDEFKYKTPSSWKIGNGTRPPVDRNEKYQYYNHIYDEKHDFSKSDKKWKKVKGGAMSLEPRIKYDFKEGVPGPGRYEPDVSIVKTKQPAYFLGEKSGYNSLNLLTGTNELVGPGQYDVINAKKTSKHVEPSKWTIGNDKRKGLNNKCWTKNETSVGNQIMDRKKSEPQISLGKSTREKTIKVGMFANMMSKQPTRIRIEHPKI